MDATIERLLDLLRGSPYLFALAIMAGSLIVAAVVRVVTTHVLQRLTARTHTEFDDQIVEAVKRPLFVTVVLIGFSFALRKVTPSEYAHYVGDGVVISLGVLLWTTGGFRIGRALLKILAARAETGKLVQTRTLPLFEIVIKVVLVGGAAYGLLLAWEVDVTAWLASAGILGIAIGFAAKDTLANFFSGIFILADAPYKIGDFIVLESGERGQVTDIGIRTTRLMTRDDIQIIVPNAAIANAKIVNESGGRPADEMRRVRIDVGVAYGSDVDQVRGVLESIAANSQYLVDDPAPRVRFRALGESSLDFQLMGWIPEPVLRGRAVDELLTSIYKRFQDAGIEIPFPQRDVHLKKE